jgi:hypothetical protein
MFAGREKAFVPDFMGFVHAGPAFTSRGRVFVPQKIFIPSE